MNNIKYWFRWIAVIPGAILISYLSTFPLHWALYFTLVKGDIVSGVDIRPIESLLYPFLVAIIFVLAGYKIAPKYKYKTAKVLFGIYFVAWLIFVVISQFYGSMYGLDMKFSFRTVLALIGAFIGLYNAKKSNEIKKS